LGGNASGSAEKENKKEERCKTKIQKVNIMRGKGKP